MMEMMMNMMYYDFGSWSSEMIAMFYAGFVVLSVLAMITWAVYKAIKAILNIGKRE